MIAVNVKINLDDVRNRLNTIQKHLGDNAITSALNKTAAQAKTRMSEAIRAEYNVSASLVRERLYIERARRGTGVNFKASLLSGKGLAGRKGSMNLIHFLEKNAQKKAFKRGSNLRLGELRFKIRKTGGKYEHKGAFIGNKGRTVFERTGTGRDIKPVWTIGVPGMFGATRNVRTVLRWIEVNLPRITEHEVKHYLSTVK